MSAATTHPVLTRAVRLLAALAIAITILALTGTSAYAGDWNASGSDRLGTTDTDTGYVGNDLWLGRPLG